MDLIVCGVYECIHSSRRRKQSNSNFIENFDRNISQYEHVSIRMIVFVGVVVRVGDIRTSITKTTSQMPSI